MFASLRSAQASPSLARAASAWRRAFAPQSCIRILTRSHSVMAAKLTSPKYIVITDMQPDRLELARSLGATHTILASDDVVSKVREITDGEMLDYVLECVGVPALTKTAHECLAPFGEIIQVGGPTDRTVPPTFSVSNHLNQSKSYRGTHQVRLLSPLLVIERAYTHTGRKQPAVDHPAAHLALASRQVPRRTALDLLQLARRNEGRG